MCTYARISLARFPSRSIFRTGPLSLAVRSPPLISAPRAFRTGPSSSLSFLPAREPRPFSLQRFNSRAISLPVSLLILPSLSRTRSFPRALAIPLSPSACHRSVRWLFFSAVPPFFLSTPPGRRVIFIICYLLRATHHRPLPPPPPPPPPPCVRRGPPGKTGK